MKINPEKASSNASIYPNSWFENFLKHIYLLRYRRGYCPAVQPQISRCLHFLLMYRHVNNLCIYECSPDTRSTVRKSANVVKR